MFTVTGGHVIWLTEQRQAGSWRSKKLGFRKNAEFRYNTEFRKNTEFHKNTAFRWNTEFRKNTEFRMLRNSAYIQNSVKNTEICNLIPAEFQEKIPQNSDGIPYHGIPLDT